MADNKITEYNSHAAPATGDQFFMIGTSEEYRIDYDTLASAILDKLTTKTYSGISNNVIDAIAALNSSLTPSVIVPGYVLSRVSSLSGGYVIIGNIVVVACIITANATASNSPQVFTLPSAYSDTALSCIDITNGIGSSISEGVPAGVATDGKCFVKTIAANHIYAVSGSYITAP